MATEKWRVIDTGLRPAAQNIALTRALLEARRAEESPSTLRFLRFAPSALLGCRQSAEQELDLAYCNANRVTVQRRITGGGAIYLDEGQIAWELYLHLRDVGTTDMQAISRRICHAAATAVSALGIDARFRPRNDIEVDGCKISETGGMFDGAALVFQGTLLVEFDVGKMLRVLRIPAGKLTDKAIAAARERVTSLKEVLGRGPDTALVKRYFIEAFESEFNCELLEGEITLSEHARYEVALREIDTPDWVHLVRHPASDMPLLEAQRKFAGGTLRVALAFELPAQRVRQIWFTGDFFVNPRRTIADLEAALRDAPLDQLERRLRTFFVGRRVDMLSLTPDDFITVIRLALKQPLMAQNW